MSLPRLLPILLMVPALVAQAPIPKTPTKKSKTQRKESPVITTASGLRYQDHQEGVGPTPTAGQIVKVHYTGWLSEAGAKGRKFDSSLDRGEALSIPIGIGRVIKGWDEGLATMKVGGKRTLFIPSGLGYGARGAGGVIPPNAELIFDVELIAIHD